MTLFKAILTIRGAQHLFLGKMQVSMILIMLFRQALLSADSSPVVITAMPYTGTEISAGTLEPHTVIVSTTPSGALYTGALLYLTDSLLVLWLSTEPWSAEQADTFALALACYEIDQIVVVKKAHSWTWAAGFALAGGALGALASLTDDHDDDFFNPPVEGMALLTGAMFGACGTAMAAIRGLDDHFLIFGDADRFAVAAVRLRSHALFPASPPDGLRLPTTRLPAEYVFHEITPAPPLSQRPRAARVHLLLGSAWRQTPVKDDLLEAFNRSGFGGIESGWFGPIEYPIDESRSFGRHIGVDYSLNRHFRLGLASTGLPVQKISGRDWEHESAKDNSYGFFVTYLPQPAHPELGSRFEVALRAGLGYHAFSVSGMLSSVFGIGIFEKAVYFEQRKRCIGVHLECGIAYYLSRRLSLHLQGEAGIIPSIKIPPVTFINPYTHEEKKLQPHSVNFSGIGLTAGLCFHFFNLRE